MTTFKVGDLVRPKDAYFAALVDNFNGEEVSWPQRVENVTHYIDLGIRYEYLKIFNLVPQIRAINFDKVEDLGNKSLEDYL